MQRILALLLIGFSSLSVARGQVTQFSSNSSLDVIGQLGSGKAILVQPSTKSIWVTDATTGGTFKLSDTLMYDGAGGFLNGNYVFAAISPTLGSELWLTNGTVAGTRLVKDIHPGLPGSEPQDEFTFLNGRLYFSASTPAEGRELWYTDGTAAGTALLKDIVAGPAGSALKGSYEIFSTGTYLLFNAVTTATGYELWRSDGTENGTNLLKDINPNAASSTPSAFQLYNGIVLFWAETVAEGRELWRTDGTTNGTQLVKDIRVGPASSINTGLPMPNISILYPLNNRLLFMADDGTTGEEIWTTDGTANGTFLLRDVNPGPERSFVVLPAGVVLNGKMYFAAYEPTLSSELWETDGTIAGTKLFKEIMPGSDGGFPFLMPNLKFNVGQGWPVHQGPVFYFMFGLPGDAGVELWKSDGTDAGTVMVKVIKTTDSDFGNLSYVYTLEGLFFSVDDGEHGDELWKSNGTTAGTTFLLDLNPNAGEGSEISFVPYPVNNKYIFTATNGDDQFNWDLYHLDGNLVGLPVKMRSFTTTLVDKDAHLRWVTDTEENTLEFVVERSDDGLSFNRIGSVAAAGTGTNRSYSFVDAQIGNSNRTVVYYRLRMKDRDGKESFSKVLALALGAKPGFSMQVLGNPVQDEVRILMSGVTAAVHFKLVDVSGRIIRAWERNNAEGLVSIPVGNITPGTYYLQAESAGKRTVVAIIKK